MDPTGETNAPGEAGADPGESQEALAPLPPHVSVGCAGLPPGLRRARYFQRLQYLENEGTRFQVPKGNVLRRWSADAGEADDHTLGRFGLYAPQEITDRPGKKGYPRSKRTWSREELWQAGGFRNTEVVRTAVATIAEACRELSAGVVIFRSPPDFVPSASNRDTLRAFFESVAPAELFADTLRVWEPMGLWEVLPAARLAVEMGVSLACDPLSANPIDHPEKLLTDLPGDTAYFRITGLGRGTQRYDDYDLEPLLDAVQTYKRTWIVFAHAHKYPDAIRCHRLLATLTAG